MKTFSILGVLFVASVTVSCSQGPVADVMLSFKDGSDTTLTVGMKRFASGVDAEVNLHDWTHFTSALAGCAKSFIDSLPFIDMGSSSGSSEGKPSKTTTTKTEAGKNSNGSLSFESKECDPCLMNILRCMLKTAICIYDHLPSKPDFQSLKGKKGKELFKAVAHNAKEAKEAADDVQG